jgi:thiosulfate/3-mercaptopyruvate sulfurtransferase
MLISAPELSASLGSTTVLDVRWDVGNGPDREAYEDAHVPGAVFVDLDVDLAAKAGEGGRHPLPPARAFEAAMRRCGVLRERRVVVYDARGATAAARAWWLLRYFGHPDVRVLDGGLAAWRAGGFELNDEAPVVSEGDFVAVPGGMPVLDAAAAGALALDGVLIDARAAERFRGESEPIDPVAGHIPGAVNRPTTLNLDPESGRFLEPAALRAAFEQLGVAPETPVGAYCGSGVTAAHEVLALVVAGFPQAALYAGSWSEWIRDPGRKVARG